MEKLATQPVAPLYVEGYSRRVLAETKYAFDHLIRYHLASQLTLAEQGVVPRASARRLVQALLELGSQGVEALELDPALEDVQPNLERAVTELAGDDAGGDLSLGRARAEFGYVAESLAVREDTLRTLETVLGLDAVLLELAERHLETVGSYYTCQQRAEPMTFGYYFASFAEELHAATERLWSSYGRLQRSPAGVANVASGPIVVDRRRLAELLGLGEPVEHALYGYWNVDVHVDALGALALTAGTVMRLALDLYQWSGSDVGVMSFAPEFYGGSFVMPQKRNPSWLEPVRRGAFAVKGCHDQALEMFMHSPPMVLVGLYPVPGLLHRAGEELRYVLDLLCAALATAEIDAQRSTRLAAQDFTQAAQLANLLAASGQTTWRQAQRVVGQLVQEALQHGMTPQELDPRRMEEIAQGRLGLPVTVDAGAFRAALDPAELVRTRTDCGPAPDAVAAALGRQRAAAEDLRSRVVRESDRIAGVWEALDREARAL